LLNKEKTVNDMTTANKDKLIADMKVVVADAEEMLRVSANQAGDKFVELRGRLQDHLTKARASLADAQTAVVDKAKKVGHATDDYVHDHPWRSVGVAAGIGLVVGLLIGRR
jgi:ElaB/YqjD/DUF883 family membrane-anchored ribosome-binding protein